jgi:hypothetical protein
VTIFNERKLERRSSKTPGGRTGTGKRDRRSV